MLKKAYERVKNLFIYCGLSRENYRLVQKEAYTNNFLVWKALLLLIVAAFSVLYLVSFRLPGYENASSALLALIIYSAVTAVLFQFVIKKDSLIGQLMIYMVMVLMIAYAIQVSFVNLNMMSVSFVVMLILLPMFMIDRPYCMVGFLCICIGVFLLRIRPYKSPEIFELDMTNCIFYGVLGMIINVFYVTLRMRQFVLQYHEKQHIEEQHLAAEETDRLNKVLKKTCESLIEVMGDIVESRDQNSGQHISRVKGYTFILATQVMKDMPEYGLDPYMVDLITVSSALHDVGKIAVPDAVLNKLGKLAREEYDIMKTHCVSGCSILEKMRDRWSSDYYDTCMSICRSHHEKWDGGGYPDGLKGDEIPIAAQIVSIADIFDALTTKRIYKEAYTPEKALSMIENGECGTISPGLLRCLAACRDQFIRHHDHPESFRSSDRPFELVSRSRPEDSFVLGFHDQDRTLRERTRLNEELSVLKTLSEELLYICYVNMSTNQVIRFSADKRIAVILDSFGPEIRSNERFDKLLNFIIVSEDYADFRKATERNNSIEKLSRGEYVANDFRIRLQDGIHYCRMKISLDKQNRDAVIIGISIRDEEHAREEAYMRMQQELAVMQKGMEDQEKLSDRLAVIDCISSDYDYVCSLNAKTMEVVVYRAEEWIRDMFKNLEDIVVSPAVRSSTLKGIIHPDDFERFNEQSRHEVVMANLRRTGVYSVTYRAYKYGRLVNYQTRYAIDHNDENRIIIGLHIVN